MQISSIISNMHTHPSPSDDETSWRVEDFTSSIHIPVQELAFDGLTRGHCRGIIQVCKNFYHSLCSFFICFFRCRDTLIDWNETKDQFAKIYAVVIPSAGTDAIEGRQKRFNQALFQLAQPARQRFCQHVGCAIAQHDERISGLTAQKRWWQFNHRKYNLEKDYLTDISLPVVKTAVKTFQDEIENYIE